MHVIDLSTKISLDPAVDIKMLGDEEVWGTDPVHTKECL
jgi:hypothetical protein